MFPYDAEVLTSFLTHYNAAVWPAQAVALALALFALWLTVPPRRGSGRAIGALLAAAWLWCGLVYFLRHFAAFDFMAPVYGWAFVAEALLLTWMLVWRGLPLQFRPEPRAILGFAVAAFALLGLPVISSFGDGGHGAAQLVGLAPGPTALFTLGLLLLAPGRAPRILMLVPLLWCVLAGVMAWALGLAAAWPLPVLGLAVLIFALWPARRRA